MRRQPALLLARAATSVGLCVMLLSGCATPPPPQPRSYAVLLDNADGSTGTITVSGAGGQVMVHRAGEGATLDGTSPPYRVEPAKLDADFRAVLAARPALPVTFVWFFADTSTTLTAESKAQITQFLEAVLRRPAADISIVGHTDTLGTSESNERLGLERARLVADFIAAAKLSVIDLTVTSSGESDLLVKTPDETAEPKNRRVEITIR